MSLASRKSPVEELHPKVPDIAVPRRGEGFQLKRTPCCFLLADAEDRNLLKLNQTGVLLWELCRGEFTVGEILSLLEETFPEASGDIAKDIYRVLDEFQAAGVVELSAK
jgi:hypothetical protein